MILLNDEERKALTEWITYALKKLKCDDKRIVLLNKYINSLIKVEYSSEKLKDSLRDFMEDKVDSFVDELLSRLERKDFSFTKEPPPPPAPKKAPPPKQNVSNETRNEAKPLEYSTKAKPETIKKEESATKASKTESNSTKDKTFFLGPLHKENQTLDQAKQQDHNQTQHESSFPINSLFDQDEINHDDGENEEPQSDDTVEKISEDKIETKNTEPPTHYIIFIAGFDPNNSSIQSLYNVFTKFGRVLAIEVDEENRVAYVEFDELLPAFKAIKSHNKKSLFKNAFVQIDYAIAPDPQKLADLESEYNKRKQLRQEKKQQMLHQQLEQQKKEETEPVSESKLDIMQEEDNLKKQISLKITEIKQKMKDCTDYDEFEKLQKNLKDFQSMLSDI